MLKPRSAGRIPTCFTREFRRLGGGIVTMFDGMARALKDMRVALLAGDVRGFERAG